MCITWFKKCIIPGLACISCEWQLSAQPVKVSVFESPVPGTVTEDTVYYARSRPLQWSDFTGRVSATSNSAALSFSGFSYDAAVKTGRDTIQVYLYLQTYFVRSGSWVRSGDANAYALSHEQLHFDIAKLAELQFRDSVLRQKLSPDYYPAEIKFIFLDSWRKMSQMQDDFDRETDHGKNHGQEASWEQWITQRLPSS